MRKMILMAVSAALVLAAAVFCLGQTENNILSVFQVQTEAQADDPPITEEEEEEPGEDGGELWIKGYAMQQVYYTSGFQWSLSPYTFIINKGSAFCCVKHNQCTACLKSEEENTCKYLKGL